MWWYKICSLRLCLSSGSQKSPFSNFSNSKQAKPTAVSGNVSWACHYGKWRVLKKLEIELLYDPAIPLLPGHISRKDEALIRKYTCTPVSIAAPFTIAKTWKQPKSLHTDNWLKMWRNRILLSHQKEWNTVICRNLEGSRDDHTKWSQSGRDKYYMMPLKCGI